MPYYLSIAAFVLSSVIALSLHEAAHLLMAYLLGVRVKRIGINWRGPFIVRDQGEPVVNACISLAGPLANLVIAALAWTAAHTFAEINVVLGISNLIPVQGTDGWRAWLALRASKTVWKS